MEEKMICAKCKAEITTEFHGHIDHYVVDKKDSASLQMSGIVPDGMPKSFGNSTLCLKCYKEVVTVLESAVEMVAPAPVAPAPKRKGK